MQHNATIRETAKAFNVGKSTVHKDLSEKLKKIDQDLYEQVKLILSEHLKTRHLKGGKMTKLRYSLARS